MMMDFGINTLIKNLKDINKYNHLVLKQKNILFIDYFWGIKDHGDFFNGLFEYIMLIYYQL
jgi:hypothetical protein